MCKVLTEYGNYKPSSLAVPITFFNNSSNTINLSKMQVYYTLNSVISTPIMSLTL